MNVSLIQNLLNESLAGTITFPQVVAKLIEAGVESYHMDLVRGESRYYMPNGESHVEHSTFKDHEAAQSFSVLKVQMAIKAIQTGQIKFQEFLYKVMSAGTVYYIVYLSGKKVVYFGRDGDFHIEPFPQ